MSDHLPECPHADPRKVTFYGGYCVCPLLRACERRIKTHEGCADAERIEGYVDGYAAGLDAAQDAVAAISGHSTWPDMSYNDGLIDALAAIDAQQEIEK